MEPLRIVVCVKPVPDPAHWDRVELDSATGNLKRAGIPTVMNPLDRNALEAGLQMKTGVDDAVIVLAMAPPDTLETLRQGLAMGADRAVLLTDRAFAGADTLATSYALATAIRKLDGADIVLCGVETVDGSTGQVGPQIAEYLGIPHISSVTRIDGLDESGIRLEARMDRRRIAIQAELPVLLTVTKDANTPRYVSLSGLLDAQEKEIVQWTAEDIGAEFDKVGAEGSACAVESLFMPETSRRREVLDGTPAESGRLLVERLRASGAL